MVKSLKKGVVGSSSVKSKEVVSSFKNNRFYFFLLAYVLALFVLIILFRPFLYALVFGAIIGVFFFPVNKFLEKFFSMNVSSLLSVFIVFLLVVFGSYLFINSVVVEVYSAYDLVSSYDFEDVDLFVESFFGLSISSEELFLPFFVDTYNSFSSSVPSLLNSFFEIFIGLFVMLFLLFYLFKDGENIFNSVMSILPVSDSHKVQLRDESRKVLFGVMYGQLLMALIQGFIGGFAFFIFGLNNPVFWGLAMAVLAFIPMLGTPLVWLPAGILQLYQGNLVAGIGVLVVGVFVIFIVENVIKPRYIGKKSGMHPLLVLLGIFGGLKLLGFLGMLIGPIIVALCVLVIRFFNQELIGEEKKD